MSDPTIPPASDPRPPLDPAVNAPVNPPFAGGAPLDYASAMPPAPVTDANAKTWGTIAHLSGLAGFVIPLGNVVGPLVVWLMKKDEIPFAGDQAKEALNFNITWSIALLIAAATLCIGIGFILLPLIGLFMLVMTIIATMKANQGEWYRYPATLRLVK